MNDTFFIKILIAVSVDLQIMITLMIIFYQYDLAFSANSIGSTISQADLTFTYDLLTM